eukprot:5789813-Amphidinium_carterae.1
MIATKQWLCGFVIGLTLGLLITRQFGRSSSSASAGAQLISRGSVALQLADHESQDRTQIAKPAMQVGDGLKAHRRRYTVEETFQVPQLPQAAPMERCTLHWMSEKVLPLTSKKWQSQHALIATRALT